MNARAQLYWLLRRELWENRSIYIAPVFAAGLALVGFLISLAYQPGKLQGLAGLAPVRQAIVAATPYSFAASMILFTCWIVAVLYCVDALNAERRDRSILFWKSMPVSDLVTVLSKAAIALVVLPIVGCVAALATQLVMLLASTAVLLAKGLDPTILWAALPLVQMPVTMFYGMAVHALWFAPILAWLLLVSAAVRRAPLLLAFLPVLAAYAVETLGYGTKHVASFVQYRLMGAIGLAFEPGAMKTPIVQFSQLDPLGFLGSPGLWLGLAFAAACLAGAVRLRRYREPT